MPPNSLVDSSVGPKAKQQKKKRIGARFVTHNTSRVRRCAGALGCD
jgi:hypothetical protein